jgi:hypothetical protein
LYYFSVQSSSHEHCRIRLEYLKRMKMQDEQFFKTKLSSKQPAV